MKKRYALFKYLLLVLFIFSCGGSDDKGPTEQISTSLYPHSDPLNNDNWDLRNSLSDEFNEVDLNLNKWVNMYPDWNGRFPSWFVADNAVVNDGELNIIMKYEHLPEMEEGYEYSTGVIRSTSPFKYGYCEVKAKCMNSAGSSAFFLNNVKWHQEQYINIDSETMPDWLGLPNNEELPSVFYVDYIRTWQKI